MKKQLNYLCIILTVIAVLLLANVIVHVHQPEGAYASSVQDVNISHISGRLLYGKTLDVKVRK